MEVLMDNYIGIDVAKVTLQVFIPKNESDVEIENSLDGLKKLYSKLKKQYKRTINDVVFVYESTGIYSTILEHYCQTCYFSLKIDPLFAGKVTRLKS